GRSVCCNAYGYYPTLHILTSVDPNETLVEQLVDLLETMLAARNKDIRQKRILAHTIKTGFPMHPYVDKPSDFIELKFSVPYHAKLVAEYLLDNPVFSGAIGEINVKPFSCLPIVETFQADRFISGYEWINITNWSSTDPEARRCEPSRCDIEIDVNIDNIRPFKDDFIAPQRVFAFDIECAKTIGIPKPDANEVILIACICADYIEGNPTGQRRRVIFQYGSSDAIDSIKPENGDLHLHFTGEDAEKRLLEAFGDLVATYDPDFLVGHNLINFDLPYVVERANVLDCSENALFLGRRGNYKYIAPRRYIKERKGGDSREMTTTETPGRIQLDTLTWIQANTRD
ncbi:MAG: 3'-5' exonuclease, partial [Formivibrio sp.]|nr:3'-5' exonuclease [Formivibrio sp.]